MYPHGSEKPRRILLRRCPHGTFHLTVGEATLHLAAYELALIDHAISHWVHANAGHDDRSPAGGFRQPHRN